MGETTNLNRFSRRISGWTINSRIHRYPPSETRCIFRIHQVGIIYPILEDVWPNIYIYIYTLHTYDIYFPYKTNELAPENGWLEDEISFKHGPFLGDIG